MAGLRNGSKFGTSRGGAHVAGVATNAAACSRTEAGEDKSFLS